MIIMMMNIFFLNCLPIIELAKCKCVYMHIIREENRLLNSLRQHQAEVINKYGEIVEEKENIELLGIEPDVHCQVHAQTHRYTLTVNKSTLNMSY